MGKINIAKRWSCLHRKIGSGPALRAVDGSTKVPAPASIMSLHRKWLRDLSLTLPCKELHSVGLYFGTPEAPSLTAIPIKSATFSVTSIRKDVKEGENAEVWLPATDAYFLMLYLEDAQHADIEADGSCSPVRLYERGSICLVDLEHGAAINLHSTLRSLAFILPKELLAEAASLSPGIPSRLVCRRGKPDAVLRNLGTTLLALFGSEGKAPPPALLQHVAVAICAHLLHHYGDTPDVSTARRPMSESQAKAAKEFMRDNLGCQPPLASIAAAAGLAADHFLQEFKRATGLTPHQWLAWVRVERAKELLSEHSLSVEAIAGRCGFSDLDHFVRAFVEETGLAPVAWRRMRLH